MESNITFDMELASAWPAIREHPLFVRLDDMEVRLVLPFFRQVVLDVNQLLLEEGQQSIDLFIVLSGRLEVIRKTETATESAPWLVGQDFRLAELTSGDSVGELGFAGGGSRSASVQCTQSAQLLALSREAFEHLEDQYPKAASRMMRNLLGATGAKLKKTTDGEVGALKMELQNSNLNSKANIFFSYVIGLLCFYNLAIHKITTLSMDASRASVISAVIILIFGVGLALMIRHNKLPIHLFGLTTRNWKRSVRESLIWSVGTIGAMVLIKWLLISSVERYHELPVLNFDVGNQKYLAFNFILYGLHSPIQEFIARGVLQGSLVHFFKGENVTLRAVIISNALFSATHVHLLGGLLGAIVFVPGLFWGWLYSRHENLIGVSISHILIGWTGLFFLDLESLF